MTVGQPIGRGNTAEIYLWEEGVILKLFDPRIPHFLIEQEYLASKEAEILSLPVAKTYGTQMIDGRQGILYEKIEGESFTNLLFGNASNVEKMAEEFASLHQTIHHVKTENLPALKETLNRNIHLAKELSDEEKNKITEYLAQLPDGDQMCHMDFHPDNIIYSSRGPILIDWMTAVRGNPLADVARTSLIFKYAVLLDAIPEAVREALMMIRNQFEKNYIRFYLQKLEASTSQVEQWYLPLMAARLCEGVPAEEKEILLREIRSFLSA